MNYHLLLDRFFPTRCLLCGSAAGNLRNLCKGCHLDLPFVTPSGCARCALPLPHSTRVCGQCLMRRPAFISTSAALFYSGDAETLVHRFKFGGDQAAGTVLASILARQAARAERPELLVPVPLSPQRLRARGFNQSWELARRLGKLLSLSADFAGVRRISNHVPQSSLPSWSARRRNVDGVFHVEPKRIKGKHVAIVDDVITSGATANSLALQLLKAGARRVDVWVACRAGLSSGARSSIEIGH